MRKSGFLVFRFHCRFNKVLAMNKIHSVLKGVYKKAKGYLFALLAVFGLVSTSYAQEGAATKYDIQIVADISDKLKATLEDFWTNNSETIYIAVGLLVATALLWMVLKFFLKSTRKA